MWIKNFLIRDICAIASKCWNNHASILQQTYELWCLKMYFLYLPQVAQNYSVILIDKFILLQANRLIFKGASHWCISQVHVTYVYMYIYIYIYIYVYISHIFIHPLSTRFNSAVITWDWDLTRFNFNFIFQLVETYFP